MICEHGEQPESIADKVVNCIKRLDSAGSKFVSTRSALDSRSELFIRDNAADIQSNNIRLWKSLASELLML